MDRKAFHFALPEELIAQAPLPERRRSRLLALDGRSGALRDLVFSDLPTLLRAGDLLVFNDTRVLPARFFGVKPTGGRIECLLERVVGPRRLRVQMKASRSPRAGTALVLDGGVAAEVVLRDGDLFEIELERDALPYLAAHGETPLPPYIRRGPADCDAERYQTVFARVPGAVAAPTAGLHFDAHLLAELERAGIELGFLTLHVGAGTFAPVRTERIEDHRLHPEWLTLSRRLCEQVAAARTRRGRVVAVGTTSVRALESAARGGSLEPFEGETTLFIYPGFRFRVVDALVTNFHLPESSLLMLVAAFAGREHTLAAYRHAVFERYRFFSYGDAMFVTPGAEAGKGDSHAV
jgi:S-adenosylmethionine:tRNA ribosyltransferase-isomerase